MRSERIRWMMSCGLVLLLASCSRKADTSLIAPSKVQVTVLGSSDQQVVNVYHPSYLGSSSSVRLWEKYAGQNDVMGDSSHAPNTFSSSSSIPASDLFARLRQERIAADALPETDSSMSSIPPSDLFGTLRAERPPPEETFFERRATENTYVRTGDHCNKSLLTLFEGNLFCGDEGYLFPGLLDGDCPVTACIISPGPKNTLLGPLDF